MDEGPKTLAEVASLFAESLIYSDKEQMRRIGECFQEWLSTAKKVQAYLEESGKPLQGEALMKHLKRGREVFLNHSFSIGELLDSLKG